MGIRYWNGDAVAWTAKNAAVRGAEKTMKEVGLAAQAVTPRKTGRLIVSRHVESEGAVHNFKIRTIYGGNGVDYAAAQEAGGANGRVYRRYTTPGTGPHYLRNTFATMTSRADFVRYIAAEVRAALGRSI